MGYCRNLLVVLVMIAGIMVMPGVFALEDSLDCPVKVGDLKLSSKFNGKINSNSDGTKYIQCDYYKLYDDFGREIPGLSFTLKWVEDADASIIKSTSCTSFYGTGPMPSSNDKYAVITKVYGADLSPENEFNQIMKNVMAQAEARALSCSGKTASGSSDPDGESSGDGDGSSDQFNREECEKEKDSLAVIHEGEWKCLRNAKTYSTVTSVDEGFVFVRRWVDRENLIPLKKGDRLMDGDEVVLKKLSDLEHTHIQIQWDDGKQGLVWFNRYSGDSFGAFYAGKRRNESSRVLIMENPDGTVEINDKKVFPAEDPGLIDLYGKDAFDVGMNILTNLPQTPAPISVAATILMSPIKMAPSMTYINVKSDIMLEPLGGGEWTLYTFQGSPEVIRLDEKGKVIDKTTVSEGNKAVVSSSEGVKDLEEFDTSMVERFSPTG